MKTAIAFLVCFFLVACNTQKGGSGDSNAKLSNKKDTISYTIGLSIGKNFKKQFIDADPAMVAAGIKDAMGTGKPLLTDQQASVAMEQLQGDIMAKHDERLKAQADEGSKFLDENKKKEGVVTTASGLQYKVLTMGKGKKPKEGDEVTVNYAGKLIDGTEFDNSAKHGGQPAVFKVGQVIPGWNEALQLMPAGSKWELYIPPALGYGAQGTPNGPIGPNATLIFEVELVSVK